jgi:ATP-dependent protease Clp ATPase subunit
MGPPEPIENRCSFCGKTEEQVARLIAGQHAFICNECVAVVHNVLTDPAFADTSGEGKTADGGPPQRSRRRRVWPRPRAD